MYRKFLLAALIALVAGLLATAYVGAIGGAGACPDWPTCHGSWLPLQPLEGVVELARLWAVQAQRLLQAGGLVLAVAALGLGLGQTGWLGVLAAVLALAGQTALLAWAPALHYHPLLEAGGECLALLALAGVYRARMLSRVDAVVPTAPAGLGARVLLAIGLLWFVLQWAGGAWVAATGAGPVCPDFPTCLGHWWPPVDYAQAWTVWRGLFDGQPLALGLGDRVAITWLHRVSGVGLVLWLSMIGMLLSTGRYGKAAARNGSLINALAFAQLLLAVLAVKYHVTVTIALLHTLLAAGLWLHLLRAAQQLARVPVLLAPPAVAVPAEAAVSAPEPAPAPLQEKPAPSLMQRLRSGLRKTGGGLAGLLAGLNRPRIDDNLLEDIETTLLMADVGVEATQVLVSALAHEYPKDELVTSVGVRDLLKRQMRGMLEPSNQPLRIDRGRKPFVVLVVGVNGVGKTTTIGKLARRYQNDGYSVMLAAGDTFRAAAVEQLQTWGERNGIAVVAQESGADSASVIFDAMQSAQAKGVDILIADTAGRLHTKSNLMEELKKIKRILGRLDETSPHEVLLVLDAGTGQNAIAQARQFHEAVNLTGIAVTKLDGTAKGGVIFALARQFGIPIRYIGVGEGIDDLQDFDADSFVDALLEQESA
jgi:fused signal recognition particle receptor